MAEHAQKLAVAFDKFDENKNQMLDFGEFRTLISLIGSDLTDDEQMDMFESGLQATSEMLGEETDSMNQTGMIKVLSQNAKKLGSGYQITRTAVKPRESIRSRLCDAAHCPTSATAPRPRICRRPVPSSQSCRPSCLAVCGPAGDHVPADSGK